MSRRRTGRVLELSIKLFACAAVLLFAVACATDTAEEVAPDTGSEFEMGDQSETEVTDTMAGSQAGTKFETIYFDFDSSSIRENARPVLRATGTALRASGASVRLEGYCDERGDEEYNLALGERRAQSTKRYLENLGVPSSQMRTLSYGEAKPASPGHNESAWRYNRRVEFKAQ